MRTESEALLTYADPRDPRLTQAVIRSVEVLSGQPRLAKQYERVKARTTNRPGTPDPGAFFAEALNELDIEVAYEFLGAPPPAEGPVVFVANHPFGVVDGLALCRLALEQRGSVKIMIHRALFKDPALQPFMLPVDFEGSREAAKRNIAVRDEAIAFLRGGGTVAVFPGGGISTASQPFGPATDLEWKLLPAKLIQVTRATVVPVFFPGQNSALFQIASQISQTLRLSLVIREVRNKRGRPLAVRVGAPIPFDALPEAKKDRKELTEHLRRVVYDLDPNR